MPCQPVHRQAIRSRHHHVFHPHFAHCFAAYRRPYRVAGEILVRRLLKLCCIRKEPLPDTCCVLN